MRKTWTLICLVLFGLITEITYADFGPGAWSLEGDSWGFLGSAGGPLWSAASRTLNETPRPIIRISQRFKDPRTGEVRELNVVPPPPRQRLHKENIEIRPVVVTGLSARVTNVEVASELLVMLGDLQTADTFDLDGFLEEYEMTLAKLLVSMPFRYHLNWVTAYSGSEQRNLTHIKQQESVISMTGLDIQIGYTDLDTFAAAFSHELQTQRITIGGRVKGVAGERYLMGLYELSKYASENVSGRGVGIDVAAFYHGTGESDFGIAIDDLYTRVEWKGVRQQEEEVIQDYESIEVRTPTLRVAYVARAGQSGAVYTEFVRRIEKNANVDIRLGLERILPSGTTGRMKVGMTSLEGMVIGLGAGKKVGPVEIDFCLSSSDFFKKSWGGGLSVDYRF
ncbi:MAG: hypothetical protein PHV61_02655 [Limnochordia bacterium]|jgi:hypothetical protein|nr:hypothetical protein [Limnochordia bacterium]MDD2629059.1 hypothetical protein [Limnochordia bacterium]MDD4518146.1 hypothetical protein [Limnochordia bacterium]